MKRIITLGSLVVLLAAVPAMAFHGHRAPQPAGPGGGMGPGMDGDHIGPRILLHHADEIGLEDAQKKEIMAMMEKFGTARIDKEAELEKAQIRLRHLHMNEASDDEILGVMDTVGRLKLEIKKMAFKHRRAVLAKLTDEQKDKIKELRQDMMKKRHQGCRGDGSGKGLGMGPGQGHGPGRGMGR
jgi:Spy/CpxP family protein refolding chaperone